MRRASRWLAPLVLTLLSPAAFPHPAAASSGADSSYRAYRIPDHRWWRSSASLGGAGSHRDDGQQGGFHARSGTLRGNLGASSTWGFDSDPSALSAGFAVDVRGDRSHDETRWLDPTYDVSEERARKNLVEGITASGSWRRYPWRRPFGLTLATVHAFSLSQRFFSTEGTSIYPLVPGETVRNQSSSAAGDWSYQGVLSAGVGYGRVRDATPVHQAQVLEDRLRRTGALGRALSPEARYRVAALLASRVGVGYAHQRPDKFFWEALERVLRDDGALERGSLDAYSAHRVLEPILSIGSVSRRIGYFVGPAVVVGTSRTHSSREEAFSYQRFVGGVLVFADEFRSDVERTDRVDDVRTALVAEAHRPMGLRWQLDAAHSTQVGESGSFVATSTLLSASYLVSDRWVGGVSAQHSALATGRDSARRIDTWDVGLSASIHYFLEDAWALSLTASEAQSHRSSAFNRGGSFSLGITRILSGYFDLPGAGVAMRPTPPSY